MDTGESALHFWDPEFCDFEDRAPIRAFSRASARSKFDEILKKCSKIIKKSKKIAILKIMTIFILYRNTWKWYFRSKWRLLVKLFKHLSLKLDHFRTLYRSQMSGKHAQNIWRTSRDVYSQKVLFFFWKNLFFFFRFFL